MKSCILLLASVLLVSSCASEKPVERKAFVRDPSPAPKPADETQRFPEKNRTAVRIETPHVLGKGVLGPGNVADYKGKDAAYQLFLVKAKSSDAAALMLFDLKGSMSTAKYVPSFGGYYGGDNAAPIFAFQKGNYLAGVVGLQEKAADTVAREFAARLN